MQFGILEILTLIGSVGMFLYGMKLMSEGLQKAAGDKLRHILAMMTNNRLLGALTGIFITALIQSSSATTVMIVSFVNAGLLSLGQSMAVIMGANVGTTLTAWIIALFGFKINIAAFAIPLVGFGVPLLFLHKNIYKSWGEFLIGFAPEAVMTAILFSFLGYFSGLGKTNFVFIQGLIQSFLIRLPVSYIMSKQPNPNLAYVALALPLSSTVGIIMCVGYYFYLNRKKVMS